MKVQECNRRKGVQKFSFLALGKDIVHRLILRSLAILRVSPMREPLLYSLSLGLGGLEIIFVFRVDLLSFHNSRSDLFRDANRRMHNAYGVPECSGRAYGTH